MSLKFFSKRIKGSKVKIENERDVINAFFLRPLEVLRFMSAYDAELKTTILEKVSEELRIVERSVRDHVDKVLEVNFYTSEADGKIYKNNKLFEWLRAYLLPFFPKKENEIIRWMLLNNSNNIDATMIARSKVYTQRIDDALREEFESVLGQKTIDNLVKVIWGVSEGKIIRSDFSNAIRVRINNENEVIGVLFKKPLEVMRILFVNEAEQKTTLVKKVSEKLEITDQAARRHINKIVKSRMLITGEKRILVKNPELVKWLWSYILQFYPERERKSLETMLLGVSTKFTKSQLAKIKRYTGKIEMLLGKEFKYDVDEKTMKKIISLIWNVFRDEKIKTDLY